MIGVADVQRDRASGRPQLMRTYIVDKATAYTAAQAITAALFARERDPSGAASSSTSPCSTPASASSGPTA